MPPAAVTASLMRPTRGLAVRPEKPSEPPHLTPSTSSDERHRLALRLRGDLDQFVDQREPLLDLVLGLPARRACGGWRPRRPRASSLPVWLDSQPSPTISTPPALGWLASAASSLRVPARSSPSCEQPNGWAKAWTPSIAAGVAGGGALGDLLRGARDAADRRDHPDLVARADAAIGPAIALEDGTAPAAVPRRGDGLVGIAAAGLQRGRRDCACGRARRARWRAWRGRSGSRT